MGALAVIRKCARRCDSTQGEYWRRGAGLPELVAEEMHRVWAGTVVMRVNTVEMLLPAGVGEGHTIISPRPALFARGISANDSRWQSRVTADGSRE